LQADDLRHVQRSDPFFSHNLRNLTGDWMAFAKR
jgi:hypothetical protein